MTQRDVSRIDDNASLMLMPDAMRIGAAESIDKAGMASIVSSVATVSVAAQTQCVDDHQQGAQ